MPNLNNFFFTERNLGKVIRFSNQMRIKDESVAEHTFHTALYAMILADLEISMGNRVDVEKLLRACLLHDLEESMTGDILHGFKYSNPDLLKNVKKMGEEFYKNIVDNLPGDMPDNYIEIWKGAKGDDIEGRILEAADKIEALVYSIEEYSLGNKNFKEKIDGIMKILEGIDLKSLKIILRELEIPK